MRTTEIIGLLAQDLLAGKRRALAQAISLVESTNAIDMAQAAMLLEDLNAHQHKPSRRIAVSGSPGVGKSTLLERLGLSLIEQGHTVAIVAVDPSSRRTGGSILGDKVRMPQLALHDRAFVRPSPSRQSLGGAAAATRDVITLCEAAGYDTVIVETVGVGQSEVEAADMVDLFLLLVLPSAGDELQGIKRGIMEVADAVIVTKSDLSIEAANVAVARYRSALQLMQPTRLDWTSPVAAISSISSAGLDELLVIIDHFFRPERLNAINTNRQNQNLTWFDDLIKRRLLDVVASDHKVQHRLSSVRTSVQQQQLPPTVAVHQFLSHLSVSITETP